MLQDRYKGTLLEGNAQWAITFLFYFLMFYKIKSFIIILKMISSQNILRQIDEIRQKSKKQQQTMLNAFKAKKEKELQELTLKREIQKQQEYFNSSLVDLINGQLSILAQVNNLSTLKQPYFQVSNWKQIQQYTKQIEQLMKAQFNIECKGCENKCYNCCVCDCNKGCQSFFCNDCICQGKWMCFNWCEYKQCKIVQFFTLILFCCPCMLSSMLWYYLMRQCGRECKICRCDWTCCCCNKCGYQGKCNYYCCICSGCCYEEKLQTKKQLITIFKKYSKLLK